MMWVQEVLLSDHPQKKTTEAERVGISVDTYSSHTIILRDMKLHQVSNTTDQEY
jgi:hypothetical protein